MGAVSDMVCNAEETMLTVDVDDGDEICNLDVTDTYHEHPT
jgi:hypothetical protein